MDQANSLREIVKTEIHQQQKKAGINKLPLSKGSNLPRVIAVTSGKGGVGKTNIVGNLAIAFSRLGKKVMILDADLGLANIDILFRIHPRYNMGHVINGEKALSEVMADGPEGIRIIPAGSGFADFTHLTEGQKLNILSEFESLDEMVDILLIDTGAGISSNVIYFNLAADECIIVATDEPTSITDAYAMIKVMSSRHGTNYFKILINMVKDEMQAKMVYLTLSKSVDRFINDVVLEYIGFLPTDPLLRQALINRSTVIEMYPSAASSAQFCALANNLVKSPARWRSEGNIKFFLKRFMDYKAASGMTT
ncbi:MAG: MinD/ParA family protein [Pseudomonadota bacterium]